MRSLFWAGVVFLLAAILLQVATDAPRSGELTLLTVADAANGGRGGTADVRLEIRPGTGAVFIDSFPLTRLDTQASTRYAQQVACDHLGVDCAAYDFYYTIRANTAVVGGPSAGGAMAVLTAAVLDGIPVNRSIAMTGTINSGGVIGPVSGVRAKIDGARRAGIATVLIPVLTGPENETSNVTLGPLARGVVPELSTVEVTVVAVGTLDEALSEFTGRPGRPAPAPPIPPPEYSARMRAIGDGICARNDDLRSRVAQRRLAYQDPNNYTRRIAAVLPDEGYARASLCFSQNIELGTVIAQDLTEDGREALLAEVLLRVAAVDNRTAPISTVGDLEVAAIVRERTSEALDAIGGINVSDPASAGDLAYADERVRSAESWSGLYGMPGAPLRIDDERVRRACLAKIAEADERINYVRVYAPGALAAAEDSLARAYASDADPVLCILHAAKATADANLIAGAIAVDSSRVDALLAEKLAAGERVLAERQAHGSFPILAYSYWRYAGQLRDDAPYSALTFAEQALELATLDMYFPRNGSWRLSPSLAQPLVFFFYGAAFALGISLLLWHAKALEGPARHRCRAGPSREKR